MIKKTAGMYPFPVFLNRSKERNGAVPATRREERFQLKAKPVCYKRHSPSALQKLINLVQN